MTDCTTSTLPIQCEQNSPSQVTVEEESTLEDQKEGLGNPYSPIATKLLIPVTIKTLPEVNIEANLKPEYQYKLYKCKDLKNLPIKSWMVQGLFGTGDIGIFYGPSGHGKTFVILNMAASMSLGQCIADEFEVKRPLKIIYCAGEGSDGIKERIEAIENGLEVSDLPNLQILLTVPQLFMGHKNTYLTSHVIKFIEECKAQQDSSIDVLIIDTLHSACVGAKENDSTDMGIVLHNIKHIAKELGCVVLLLHHTTKDKESFRGSSALEGDVDLMVKIAKTTDTDGTGMMSCEKLKDGKNWGTKNFKLTESGSSAYASFFTCKNLKEEQTLKEEIINFLTKNRGEKYNVREVFTSLNKTSKKDTRVRDSLNELVKAGRCKKDEPDSGNVYYI